MKKIIVILMLCALLSGCTTQTEFGECIGVADSGKKELVYKASLWNVVLAVIFVETIIVPVWVIIEDFKCPVAKQ